MAWHLAARSVACAAESIMASKMTDEMVGDEGQLAARSEKLKRRVMKISVAVQQLKTARRI